MILRDLLVEILHGDLQRSSLHLLEGQLECKQFSPFGTLCLAADARLARVLLVGQQADLCVRVRVRQVAARRVVRERRRQVARRDHAHHQRVGRQLVLHAEVHLAELEAYQLLFVGEALVGVGGVAGGARSGRVASPVQVRLDVVDADLALARQAAARRPRLHQFAAVRRPELDGAHVDGGSEPRRAAAVVGDVRRRAGVGGRAGGRQRLEVDDVTGVGLLQRRPIVEQEVAAASARPAAATDRVDELRY